VKFWKPIRLLLLVATCGGVFWGFGQSIFSPQSTEQEQLSFVLPSDVPLPGWQLLDSRAVVNPSGRIYQYRRNNLQVKLEVYYVTDAEANQDLFRQYSPSSLLANVPTLVQHNQQGFYSLSVEQSRAYLRTCINPRGESTITYDQFVRNRYLDDLKFSRLLPWLLGQVSLRDHRCLWTHLSIPVKGESPQPAYRNLEKVWTPWHKWWQEQFPEP
jgi:cyanosortase A-associated protein